MHHQSLTSQPTHTAYPFWQAWLFYLPISLALFTVLWLSGNALTDLLALQAWQSNDHLLKDTVADPIILTRFCLSVALSILGARVLSAPLLRMYTSFPHTLRRVLGIITVIVCILSSCILFLSMSVFILSLTAPDRASTNIAGYRIHLTQRDSNDLDFGELVLIVTRSDGAYYEHVVEDTWQNCRDFSTATTGALVTLHCSFPRGEAVSVVIDRQQEILWIRRNNYPEIQENLTTITYTQP